MTKVHFRLLAWTSSVIWLWGRVQTISSSARSHIHAASSHVPLTREEQLERSLSNLGSPNQEARRRSATHYNPAQHSPARIKVINSHTPSAICSHFIYSYSHSPILCSHLSVNLSVVRLRPLSFALSLSSLFYSLFYFSLHLTSFLFHLFMPLSFYTYFSDTQYTGFQLLIRRSIVTGNHFIWKLVKNLTRFQSAPCVWSDRLF